ncbi:hypothetical protein [Pseudomonas sp. Pseu.R1]|uniref:hypothetical protein n=1 Tax=Pseudomonas sp. Pseu.R1 TaxID=3379818 RepID=UPI003B9416E5
MEHKKISGLVNIVKLNQAAEILEVARNRTINRAFASQSPFLDWLLIGRILKVLSYKGQRFPTMGPRTAIGRNSRQHDFWRRLNPAAPEIRARPDYPEPLAEWVKNANRDAPVGLLFQQAIGRLLKPTSQADATTWGAGKLIAGPLPPGNTWRNLRWKLASKVTQAKAMLASRGNDDLSGVHGLSVAIHNIFKGMYQMRDRYADSVHREAMTPAMIRHLCLYAPGVVLHGGNKKCEGQRKPLFGRHASPSGVRKSQADGR